MTTTESAMKPVVRSTLVAALLASSAWAQAALLNFTGATDFGPLSPSSFSGSLSYADPLPADFTGAVALDSFVLSFAGQTYTLAGADLPASAYFDNGNFIGTDYMDTDSTSPGVAFSAGFSDLSEASMSYFVADLQGFGGFTSVTVVTAVPEPASAALLLAGLGLAASRRRRRA